MTQTHFKSGDDDAPTTRPLVTRTHTGAATTTIQHEAEGRGHRRSLNRCGWCAALPPPHPVPGQGNSLHLRLHIRSGWATLKTHTCCISDSPAVPAKRTRAEGSRQTLPFSHQEQSRVGEGEIKKRVSSPEREILPQPWGKVRLNPPPLPQPASSHCIPAQLTAREERTQSDIKNSPSHVIFLDVPPPMGARTLSSGNV